MCGDLCSWLVLVFACQFIQLPVCIKSGPQRCHWILAERRSSRTGDGTGVLRCLDWTRSDCSLMLHCLDLSLSNNQQIAHLVYTHLKQVHTFLLACMHTKCVVWPGNIRDRKRKCLWRFYVHSENTCLKPELPSTGGLTFKIRSVTAELHMIVMVLVIKSSNALRTLTKSFKKNNKNMDINHVGNWFRQIQCLTWSFYELLN